MSFQFPKNKFYSYRTKKPQKKVTINKKVLLIIFFSSYQYDYINKSWFINYQ